MGIENAAKTLQVSCVQLHWAKPLEYNLERAASLHRAAAAEGSRVVVFPEANLTSYYFPFVTALDPEAVRDALDQVAQAARTTASGSSRARSSPRRTAT